MSTLAEGRVLATPVAAPRPRPAQEVEMSSGGEGIILAVPAVVVGGAVAAAAIGAVVVAGVGVGICYVAGRTLVAGAQAVQQRCADHAARRRAWDRVRDEVNRRSQQLPAPDQRAARLHQARASRRAQSQIAGLAALQSWLSDPIGAPEPAPLPSLDEQLQVEWPEPGQTRIVDVLDREAERDRLNARRRAAARRLREYAPGGVWAGLFSAEAVTRLERGVAAARRELEAGRFPFADQQLRPVEQQLALMSATATERWRQRAAALQRLGAAEQRLEAAPLDDRPELLAQWEALADLLAQAEAEFGQQEFVRAEAAAAVVEAQAGAMADQPAQWRRRLLLAEAQALREEVAAHGSFPDGDRLLAVLDQTIGQLSAADPLPAEVLARAEQTVARANQWANTILQRVEMVAAGAAMRQNLAVHCADQLAAMGYTVESSHAADALLQPDEKWRLVGRRGAPADPARTQQFVIELSADGGMWLDVTQGYKDKECDELKVFVAGLQARGVQGMWSPAYSAEQTAAHLRRLLDEEGYFFYEERGDEGLIYTIMKDGQAQPGLLVPWNGQLTAQELAEAMGRVQREVEQERAEWEKLVAEQRQTLHY